MICGFININKSDGITSQSVVNIVKKKLGGVKVGHLGTLDPSASGVLPIAVGRATKLFDLMLNKTKIYRTIFTFGVETDTLDSEGKILKKCEKIPTKKEILNAIPLLVGEVAQMPPLYSAKNVDGKRAYDLAREGIEFTLKPKLVHIFRIDLIKQVDEKSFLFEIESSSGTYVRSVCRDLATAVGSFGYVPVIIRTKSGEFEIENSISLTEFKDDVEPLSHLQKVEDCLRLPILSFDDIEYKKLISGQDLKCEQDNGRYWLKNRNEVFATGIIKDSVIKMEVYIGD